MRKVAGKFLKIYTTLLTGTNLFGPLGHRVGRWLASLIGMIMIGFSLILVSTLLVARQDSTQEILLDLLSTL